MLATLLYKCFFFFAQRPGFFKGLVPTVIDDFGHHHHPHHGTYAHENRILLLGIFRRTKREYLRTILENTLSPLFQDRFQTHFCVS